MFSRFDRTIVSWTSPALGDTELKEETLICGHKVYVLRDDELPRNKQFILCQVCANKELNAKVP